VKQVRHPGLLKGSSQAGDTNRFGDESMTAPSTVTMEATAATHNMVRRVAADNAEIESPSRITVTSSQLSGSKQITARKFE